MQLLRDRAHEDDAVFTYSSDAGDLHPVIGKARMSTEVPLLHVMPDTRVMLRNDYRPVNRTSTLPVVMRDAGLAFVFTIVIVSIIGFTSLNLKTSLYAAAPIALGAGQVVDGIASVCVPILEYIENTIAPQVNYMRPADPQTNYGR